MRAPDVNVFIDDGPRESIKRVLMEAGVKEARADGYAELICRELSGRRVYFRRQSDTTERDARIRAERQAGDSLRCLAKRHWVSRSTIRRVLGKA